MKAATGRSGRCLRVLVAAATVLLFPALSLAGMKAMTDGELSGVVGQGFSSFTMVDGTARADFSGVSGSTFTEIESLKMGYWDKGDGGGKGWDQNWSQVKLGSAAKDLTFNGFFFQAVFDPATVNDPANRRLLSLSMGSKDVTGELTANFSSLTGLVSGGEVVRGAQGVQTYQFNHSELSLNIDVSGARQGVWVNLGNATRL